MGVSLKEDREAIYFCICAAFCSVFRAQKRMRLVTQRIKNENIFDFENNGYTDIYRFDFSEIRTEEDLI